MSGTRDARMSFGFSFESELCFCCCKVDGTKHVQQQGYMSYKYVMTSVLMLLYSHWQ